MKLKNLFIALLTSIVISSVMVGCSDDKPEQAAKTVKAEEPFDPFDHSQDKTVSASEKDKFEAAFVAQCVKREMLAAPNSDKDKFTRPCTCIADELSKTLTAKEAEKFMTEHENPVSLTFKFENAAYHCVQEKAPPKDSGFTPVTQ
ncbi:MAG: hypothetical protein Q8N30_12350 [Methylococcales bacterium]|nr:hypothetical protein [Methylococcales bacterium]